MPTHRADRFGQAQPFVVEPFEFARFDLAQGGPAFEQSRNSLVSYARCVTHAFRSEGGEVLGEFTDHAQRHTTRLLALNKRSCAEAASSSRTLRSLNSPGRFVLTIPRRPCWRSCPDRRPLASLAPGYRAVPDRALRAHPHPGRAAQRIGGSAPACIARSQGNTRCKRRQWATLGGLPVRTRRRARPTPVTSPLPCVSSLDSRRS